MQPVAHTVRVNWTGAVAVLVAGIAISVVLSTALATRAFRARVAQIERADQSVTVKGSARVPLRADQAVWTIQLHARDAALPAAFATLDGNVERARTFLTAHGFLPEHIALSAVTTQEHPVYDSRGNATMQIEGYTLRRTITVATTEVARVASAAGAITSLLEEGVALNSYPPQFTCSKLPDIKVDLVGAATADARARAEEIATKAGATLAEVRTASQGVMQITTPGSTEVSSYGIYDTSTIEKEAALVMTLTFGLDRGKS
jgi:Uncharacterized protein conserved in bacteria